MTSPAEKHIAANEAVITSSKSATTVALAKENVDLWLSIAGQPGKYGTSYAATPAPKAPVAPAPAPDTITPAQGATSAPEDEGKSARQAEYDELLWQATLAGHSAKEAERLATNELARRHGEAVNLDNLSLAEVEAHLKGMDPALLNPNNRTFGDMGEPMSEEDYEANVAALRESMSGAQMGVTWPPKPTEEQNPLRAAGFTDEDMLK
jgi:hypothetical protein